MARSIAIVEDEPDIRANYAAAFSRQGYRVQTYATRREALDGFAIRLPELAIIDVGLGDEAEGGFDLCRELRARDPALPIIFLTARDSDLDVVSGLRLGADDYLSKSVSLPQLLARVAALLRRVEALREPLRRDTVLERGPLRLDLDRMSTTWLDRPVHLTVTETWIVRALVRHPGHVRSREQLMREAELVVDDTTITSHIKRIRRKFQEVDGGFACIETVYAMGYRWLDQP